MPTAVVDESPAVDLGPHLDEEAEDVPMEAKQPSLSDEDDSPVSISLRQIDHDFAEWWCHHILYQPVNSDIKPLMDQWDVLLPRLKSVVVETPLHSRMRFLEVWEYVLMHTNSLDGEFNRVIDNIVLLGKQMKKPKRDYRHIVKILKVHNQLGILYQAISDNIDPLLENAVQENGDEKISVALEAFKCKLKLLFSNTGMPVPDELANIEKYDADENEVEDAESLPRPPLLRAIHRLLFLEDSSFGFAVTRAEIKSLLLGWYQDSLEPPKLVKLNYFPPKLPKPKKKESVRLATENVASSQDSFDSDATKEVEDEDGLEKDDDSGGGDSDDDQKQVWDARKPRTSQAPQGEMSDHTSGDEKLESEPRRKEKPGKSRSVEPAFFSSVVSSKRKGSRRKQDIDDSWLYCSDDEQEDTSRASRVRRSKSLPAASRRRKPGTSGSHKRGVSISPAKAATSKKKRKITYSALEDAIREGVSKYGKGNWILIQRRSGGVLKSMTGEQINEKAKMMGLA